jgi:hypothetical protein
MSPALTPVLALDYLRELSADIRDGVVLDAAGEQLAGEPALVPAARELMAEMSAATEAEGRTRAGVVLAARAGGLTIVLVCGPQAMPALGRHDMRLALGDLGAPSETDTACATVPAALVERLLAEVRRDPGD